MSLPVDINTTIEEPDAKQLELVQILVDYKKEAVDNRQSGLNPRDDKWRQNLDLYHNRYDFSNKAAWQSKNVMPEVPSFIDRFAGALKEALVATPNGFYTVIDPYDREHDLSQSIKNMLDVWLSVSGKNQVGTPLDFSSVFEEQCKIGAMMAMTSKVLWKNDIPGGRVAIETHDPRMVWLDHTYRGLYRIARTELDLADIARMATATGKRGKPLYNLAEMQRLVASLSEDNMVKKELSGNGEEITSNRQPIIFDEYYASAVGRDGKLLLDNEMVIVANDRFIVRGPEPNPFWHGRDWLTYAPLVTVPLSPYGRTYMEDFGAIAKVFNDLTNLLLDATYTASMKAYVLVPDMLKDPSQANTGIWPNKTFLLQDGYSAKDFATALELGSLDAGAINIWQQLKGELSEAAGMNEIGLGQLPDKTHIAATAVAGAQQSSSAILRSVAQTIETRYLDCTLDLAWKTGLQHVKLNDMKMQEAVGPAMWSALHGQRKQLITRPITFQARGISTLIQKSQKLQALLSVMQVISANPNLMQAFMQRIDIMKFVDLLFSLSNVDLSKLEMSERQQMVQSVVQPMQQAAAGGQPSGQGMNEMGNAATMMGVAQ